ncbi:MAG: nucleotide exchange factor GrpE [Candidatus Kerfeldbacteria bacterium]|nr:nucleotide exchange factor GrpE [Candidatus Kerfeldbacteria bacterium]
MTDTPTTAGPATQRQSSTGLAPQEQTRTISAADPKIAALQKQAAEYLAGWQRAKADYLNFKKQAEKDQAELAKFANAALLIELLPIYDNLKRAVQHIPSEQQDVEWVKGISHILQQFKQLFASLGLEEIKTVGQPFNHELHHAVGKEKRNDVSPNTVVEEVKSGFLMHGRMVTPAQVRVAE